jgi:hypothetical protein
VSLDAKTSRDPVRLAPLPLPRRLFTFCRLVHPHFRLNQQTHCAATHTQAVLCPASQFVFNFWEIRRKLGRDARIVFDIAFELVFQRPAGTQICRQSSFLRKMLWIEQSFHHWLQNLSASTCASHAHDGKLLSFFVKFLLHCLAVLHCPQLLRGQQVVNTHCFFCERKMSSPSRVL